MGTWIELRCEKHGPATGFGLDDRCYSDTNHGPMGMAADTRKSVADTLKDLEQEARRGGWKRTRFGWVCPHCAALPSNVL